MAGTREEEDGTRRHVPSIFPMNSSNAAIITRFTKKTNNLKNKIHFNCQLFEKKTRL